MAEVNSTKSGFKATVQGCLDGFKAAPTSTKVAGAAGTAVLAAAAFFLGRMTKKQPKK